MFYDCLLTIYIYSQFHNFFLTVMDIKSISRTWVFSIHEVAFLNVRKPKFWLVCKFYVNYVSEIFLFKICWPPSIIFISNPLCNFMKVCLNTVNNFMHNIFTINVLYTSIHCNVQWTVHKESSFIRVCVH